MSDPVGTVVAGKYRVDRRLGGGGVAEVYEAVHVKIGKRFALKILKREYAGLSEVTRRFLTEARAASAVGHPGIVQVFDIGELPSGEPYLVMEYLEGEELGEILRKRRTLSVEEALGACLHILDALDAAHRAGVIHRDLKPENVFLVRGPEGQPWAKIIDFGIARLAREGPFAKRSTAEGTVVGTPYYVSPEQARAAPRIDGRADVYAVGVMLYELLTGDVPFDGASSNEILTKVLSQPFPSPRALNPEVSPELEQVILRATAKKPGERYTTASQFAAALRSLKGETVTVHILSEEDDAAEISSLRRLRELAATPPPPPPPPPGRRPGMPEPEGTGASRAQGGFERDSDGPSVPATQAEVVAEPAPAAGRAVAQPRMAPYLVAGLVAGAIAASVAVGVAIVFRDTPAERADAPVPPGGVSTLVAAAEAGGVAVDPDASATEPLERARSADEVHAERQSHRGDQAGGAAVTDGKAREARDVPPGPRLARITLTGLPANARATVDGQPVENEFEMEIDDVPHTLRVAAKGGYLPFVQVFRVTEDLAIDVELRRSAVRDPGARRDAGASRPPVDRGTGTGAARDGPPPLLGNPFGDR